MASTIKLNEPDKQELLKRLKKLYSFSTEDAIKVTRDTALTTVARMKKIAPVDTGNLRNNIKFEEKKAKATAIDVEIQSNAPYSGHVEFSGHNAKRSGKEIPYFFPTMKLGRLLFIKKLKEATKKAFKK